MSPEAPQQIDPGLFGYRDPGRSSVGDGGIDEDFHRNETVDSLVPKENLRLGETVESLKHGEDISSDAARRADAIESLTVARESDNGLVLEYLVKLGEDNADPEIFASLYRVLQERYAGRENPEAWQETMKTLREMEAIIKDFDDQVAEFITANKL